MLNVIRIYVTRDAANKLLTFNGWRRSNQHKSELAVARRSVTCLNDVCVQEMLQNSEHNMPYTHVRSWPAGTALRQLDSSLNASVLCPTSSLGISDVSNLGARTNTVDVINSVICFSDYFALDCHIFFRRQTFVNQSRALWIDTQQIGITLLFLTNLSVFITALLRTRYSAEADKRHASRWV